jgi:HlyD family secretion protein
MFNTLISNDNPKSNQMTIRSQKTSVMRIVVVDDQKAVRCKLEETLATEDDIEIVGTAEDGDKAIALIKTLKPDVILMDIEMPTMDGIKATEIIVQRFPQVKTLILTTHKEDEYVQKIFSAGANGYILKYASSSDLVTAIRSVYNGYSYFSPGTLKKIQLSFSPTKQVAQKAQHHPEQLDAKEGRMIAAQSNSSAENIFRRLFESRNKKIFMLIFSAIAIAGATLIHEIFPLEPINSNLNTVIVTPATPVNNRRISALGRVEPITEVIKISVPVALSNDRIAKLLVKRGDLVQIGQVIAILDSRLSLENALVEAKAQLKVAQAKLAQVQAGATPGEIAAQEIEIFRLQQDLKDEVEIQRAIVARRQAEVEDAKSDYNRYLSLYQQQAISASDLDRRKLALATAQTQAEEARGKQNQRIAQLREEIRQAQANLDQIAQVRPTDVAVTQSEVDKEMVTVKKARDDLKAAYIQAPISGRIFDIKTKPGEVVGSDGIVEMGKTSQMDVVAEVYESDIAKIREGQQAQITSDSFSGKLQGTVRQIGLQVIQQKVTSGEPGENLDRKVIEVRIELNPHSSQKVSSLTNLQVQVLI